MDTMIDLQDAVATVTPGTAATSAAPAGAAATSSVAVFAGRLDAFAAGELRARLGACRAATVGPVTADLADATYVDSAALAALVSVYKRLRADGRALRVIAPSDPAACRVFELTQFDRVFEMVARRDRKG